MGKRLSELFAAAAGAAVEWNGRSVRMMVDLDNIGDGDHVQITFVRFSRERAQGLRLKARGGTLQVGGALLEDVVLWSDTAPTAVNVTFRSMDRSAYGSVRLWNVWRDPAGSMQAWIGDAGIVVSSERPNVLVLKCSDGFSQPSFDDLVVELRHSQPAELGPVPEP